MISARPDKTAEAKAVAQTWAGRLKRAVAGTTQPLKGHTPVERTPIPAGPVVDVPFDYLRAMPAERDAATIENTAKYAIAWLRWLADEGIAQYEAFLPTRVAQYHLALAEPRTRWFWTRDALGRRVTSYETRAAHPVAVQHEPESADRLRRSATDLVRHSRRGARAASQSRRQTRRDTRVD